MTWCLTKNEYLCLSVMTASEEGFDFGDRGNKTSLFTTDMLERLLEKDMVRKTGKFRFDRTYYQIKEKQDD